MMAMFKRGQGMSSDLDDIPRLVKEGSVDGLVRYTLRKYAF
jgi:hypothetical protein